MRSPRFGAYGNRWVRNRILMRGLRLMSHAANERDSGVTMLDHARWNAGHDDPIGHGPRDDRAGADNGVATDVGHDDRGTANPRSRADAHEGRRARLIADWDAHVVDAMAAPSAGHVDAGCKQRGSFHVDQ